MGKRLAFLALLVTIGSTTGCGPASPSRPPEPAPPTAAQPTPGRTPPQASPARDGAREDNLRDDDGRTLWASPTEGESIDPSVVPDQSALFVWARPAALLANEEGHRVWQALGPAFDAARRAIEAEADKPLDEVATLALGIRAGESYGQVAAELQIEPTPTDDPPLLQREIEQLLETTDRDRHFTVVFSPRFLLGDGGSLFEGEWAPLRELLLVQTRDDWSAASLSLHVDRVGRLYWELRVLADAATPEASTALALGKQAGEWQGAARRVAGSGAWSAYSAAVVGRWPAMVSVLGKYARRGVDGRQAVLNGWAPPGAAHQLLLAGERIVAELASPAATATVAREAPQPETLAERLRRPVTVRFPRESLETAVSILSEALGAPIEILGRDLQLEGITRNQMLALDLEQTPADEALVEVLRRANPDPLAEGPSDPRQKLVYVERDGSIAVTTRAAAAKRGDTLPAVFTAQQ